MADDIETRGINITGQAERPIKVSQEQLVIRGIIGNFLQDNRVNEILPNGYLETTTRAVINNEPRTAHPEEIPEILKKVGFIGLINPIDAQIAYKILMGIKSVKAQSTEAGQRAESTLWTRLIAEQGEELGLKEADVQRILEHLKKEVERQIQEKQK